MSDVSFLESALACVVGAVDAVRDDVGVTFHRSSATARRRLQDPFFAFASSSPSGVRIETVTDATDLELVVAVQTIVFPDQNPRRATFDLIVDGEVRPPIAADQATLIHITSPVDPPRIVPAPPAAIPLHLGDDRRERRVEVWFPASSSVTLVDVRAAEGVALQPAPPSGPVHVHYGSSISHCGEADRPTETWPAIVARRRNTSLINLALAGQCQLDAFTARTIAEIPAESISLKLGINVINGDSMRERAFVPAFHGFLDIIRDEHPTTPIEIITPIWCPSVENAPGPTVVSDEGRFWAIPRTEELAVGALTLSRIRELLHEHVAIRQAEGDDNLTIFDGLALFGPDDADLMPDDLHPNAEGYRLMAERYLATHA